MFKSICQILFSNISEESKPLLIKVFFVITFAFCFINKPLNHDQKCSFFIWGNWKTDFKWINTSNLKIIPTNPRNNSIPYSHYTCTYPANIYLFKVNNRNTRKRCKISSKLTTKTSERRQWRRFGVFIVNFEHISRHFLVFLLLTLNKQLLTG